jgi:hypothetical protein
MKNFFSVAVVILGLSLFGVSAQASESRFSAETCVDRSGHGMSFNDRSEAEANALYVAQTLCDSRGRQEGHPATYTELSASCDYKLSHDGTKYYWDCNTSGECCW